MRERWREEVVQTPSGSHLEDSNEISIVYVSQLKPESSVYVCMSVGVYVCVCICVCSLLINVLYTIQLYEVLSVYMAALPQKRVPQSSFSILLILVLFEGSV